MICTKIENEYGQCYYEFVFRGDEIDYVHIYNLYVYQEFRRRGKARELLELAIKSIRDEKYFGEIQIVAVPKENSVQKDDLIRFYESLGLAVYSCYA